ncbi:TRAP transporter small permease [Mesobacillus harenae]|uniref:TRAP transporter small permease n=1 Tax=Mesobacillus harenae TaxID=2213203 RepID=UPI0015805A35|nr:TRAP transporter small permease [Mesobacillus harenae]
MWNKIDKYLSMAVNYFLVISLLFVSLLVFVNVILRYFFNTGIVGTEELVAYVIIWNVFIGASTLILTGEHLSMDALVEFIPKKIKSGLTILVSLVGILFSMSLVYYSLPVINALSLSVTPSLRIPSYIPFLAIPLGSLITSLRFIQLIIKQFKLISGRELG